MHHLIQTGTIVQVKYCLTRIGDSKDGSPIFLFGYQMGRSHSNELGDCMLGVGIELAMMVSHFLAQADAMSTTSRKRLRNESSAN